MLAAVDAYERWDGTARNWQASAGALALNDEDVRKVERRTLIFFRSIALILTLMCVLLLAWGGWELLLLVHRASRGLA